jgi:hypothetical protein
MDIDLRHVHSQWRRYTSHSFQVSDYQWGRVAKMPSWGEEKLETPESYYHIIWILGLVTGGAAQYSHFTEY